MKYLVRTICFSLPMLLVNTAAACPTCKESIHESGSSAAYATSILFMMGMPFVILLFWVVLIFRLRSQMSPEKLISQVAPQEG